LLGLSESIRAVVGNGDFVSLDLEIVAQAKGEVWVVFDDEDPAHAIP
jgi:hypothetical protein